MSKKQTSNTFGKGLVQDLHPLIVPNDTLTDALNATTVTMNGNEGILQNDMGNGRVESAFLPPGYVPVGIKEYGGIIYVASYNPITNKGQIGSFPSPERNIDLTEDGELENPLLLLIPNYYRTYKYYGFNDNNKYRIGLGGLTNKIEIFGDYKIIRSGDKFGFYFDGNRVEINNNGEKILKNDRDILSNYFNFFNDKIERGSCNIKSDNQNYLTLFDNFGGWDKENGVYLNNIISLSVQVLDSNNNLRDLTYQLKRFDINNNSTKVIKFNSDEATESDKFNAGYFIVEPNTDWDPVNQERNKSALNTYNNKLFGRLYLVGTVNVIDHIDVQIAAASLFDNCGAQWQGLIQNCSQNNVLYFYIDYYFNCPENYLYYPRLNMFFNDDLYEQYDVSERYNFEGGDPGNPVNYTYDKSTYDPITNLYRKRYIAYVPYEALKRLIDDPNVNPILNYIVVPQMLNLPGETSGSDVSSRTYGSNITKLTHIAVEGSIDISKIGSGEHNIVYWRYTCNDKSALLNWGLEDYPLETDIIEDMRMEFYDWNDSIILFTTINNKTVPSTSPKYVQYFNRVSYNGSFIENIVFSPNTIEKRHIYLVRLVRNKNNEEEEIGWRILITTPIYNDLYVKYADYNPDDLTSVPDLLTDITEANKVLIDLNITEIDKSIHNLVKDDNSQIYEKDNNEYVYNPNKKFDPVIESPDLTNYSYIQYTSAEISRSLDVKLTISDKYPFELCNPNAVGYEFIVNSDIEHNALLNKIGTGLLITFDNAAVRDRELNIKKISEHILPLPPNNVYQGNQRVIIKDEYNFPSEVLFNYNTTPSTVNVKHIYKDLHTFILEELPKDILIPFTAAREKHGDSVCYFDLLKYTPHGSTLETVFPKGLNNSIVDIDETSSENNRLLSESSIVNGVDGRPGINKAFETLGFNNSTFAIIGSPFAFGFRWSNSSDTIWDMGKTIIDEVLDYIRSKADGSFMLRKDLLEYLGSNYRINANIDPNNKNYEKFTERNNDNINNSYGQDGKRGNYGYKIWAILIWKSTKDDFVIFNNAYLDPLYYIKGSDGDNHADFPINLLSKDLGYEEVISNFFFRHENDDLSLRIFFKINDSKQISGYTIDKSGITYNQDYMAEIITSVMLENITIDYVNAVLNYYENNRNVNNSNNSIDVSYGLHQHISSLGRYLNFSLQTTSVNKPLNTISYKVQGLDNFINNNLNISSEVEGIIEYNNATYMKDNGGSDLIEDIYVFNDNGDLVDSTLLTDSYSGFVKSLAVRNDKLLVKAYNVGSSLHYAHSFSDTPPGNHHGGLIMTIGDLPYINFRTGSNNPDNKLME